MELELFWETFGKTASPVELGCKIVGAAWSHVFVAPPPQWKPEGAPGAAPWLELLHFRPFGRAPAGAGFGAGAGTLPNSALMLLFSANVNVRRINGIRFGVGDHEELISGRIP